MYFLFARTIFKSVALDYVPTVPTLKFSNKLFPAAESFSSMFLVKDTRQGKREGKRQTTKHGLLRLSCVLVFAAG